MRGHPDHTALTIGPIYGSKTEWPFCSPKAKWFSFGILIGLGLLVTLPSQHNPLAMLKVSIANSRSVVQTAGPTAPKMGPNVRKVGKVMAHPNSPFASSLRSREESFRAKGSMVVGSQWGSRGEDREPTATDHWSLSSIMNISTVVAIGAILSLGALLFVSPFLKKRTYMTIPGTPHGSMAMMSVEGEDKKEFLVDGKPVYNKDGDLITSKSQYKKFIAWQKKQEMKAQKAATTAQAKPQAKKKVAKAESAYSKTVLVPVTEFSLRANAINREPELQQFWNDEKIYDKLYETNSNGVYTLHDGPPYANGAVHMGHALNKILKDFIIKHKLVQGKKVKYIPGWDTHGLPIELKVLQSLPDEEKRNLKPLELRKLAKEFALETVGEQSKAFQRFGVWGDWEDPYVTLAPEYEAAQVKIFGEMVANGHIYRGRKPVFWSPSTRTALAEAEVEYPTGHTSPSVYVSMRVTKSVPEIHGFADLALAIWTTTPWTLPANRAISVNKNLSYSVVKVDDSAQHLIVATDLVETLSNTFSKSLHIEKSFQGECLEGVSYAHPLYDTDMPVVLGGDYITTEAGTGLVHTAPGHGMDDYMTGLKYDLEVFAPVDDDGKFTNEVGREDLIGLEVLTEGNKAVSNLIRESGYLLHAEAYEHKYPYDWRSKKPCITRATSQWFCSIENFRQQALDAIGSVTWIPAVGENRIRTMVEGRNDWCISRQRTWGVPIPVFYDQDGQPLLDKGVIDHVQGVFAEYGSDAWFSMSVSELLPEKYKNDAEKYTRGMDTMDVWFDSGSSWASVIKTRGLALPVDLYLEGSDQHRGWFQSSLLTSTAVTGSAPYKGVLTHGFVLDEKGAKMSKSLGNVVDPFVIIEGGENAKQNPPYGADVLRLWVASVDYTSDVLIGGQVLQGVFNNYKKIRNTARFVLGNLNDFQPNRHAVPYSELPEVDRYILQLSQKLFQTIDSCYDEYNFSKAFAEIQTFITSDLSTFYFELSKERLYLNGADDAGRRSCQTVLAYILEKLARALSPVLCHLAEDIWQNIPYTTPMPSVFSQGSEQHVAIPSNDDVDEAKWVNIREIMDLANASIEQARNAKLIGSSLEAKALIWVGSTDPHFEALTSKEGLSILKDVLLVSKVDLVFATTSNGPPTELPEADYTNANAVAAVGIVKAEGSKCERCWQYGDVGMDQEHPTLCARCAKVLVAA